jgi:hypothetical protein
MTGSWIHRDELRASWVLLLLGTTDDMSLDGESKLSHWEFGVANADNLVDTEAQQIGVGGVSSEFDLLENLLSGLDQFRYENTVIVTPSAVTLQKLRARIVAVRSEKDTLRGFSHICVESLLAEYFDHSLANHGIDRNSLSPPRVTSMGADTEEVVGTGSVHEFWKSWQRLYRLLPADKLRGNPL